MRRCAVIELNNGAFRQFLRSIIDIETTVTALVNDGWNLAEHRIWRGRIDLQNDACVAARYACQRLRVVAWTVENASSDLRVATGRWQAVAPPRNAVVRLRWFLGPCSCFCRRTFHAFRRRTFQSGALLSTTPCAALRCWSTLLLRGHTQTLPVSPGQSQYTKPTKSTISPTFE